MGEAALVFGLGDPVVEGVDQAVRAQPPVEHVVIVAHLLLTQQHRVFFDLAAREPVPQHTPARAAVGQGVPLGQVQRFVMGAGLASTHYSNYFDL